MTHPATDLRISLKAAARAAYLDGATDRQIDHIVALARGTGSYDVLSGGHLTKRDASIIIDTLLQSGAEADWSVTEAELDDQDADAAAIENREAYIKARKSQKKAEKAAREADSIAKLLEKGTDGRKVRHVRFGLGQVIEEDETTFTAKFSCRRAPMKIQKTFLEVVA